MVSPDVLVGAALVDAPEHLLRVHRVGQAVQTGVLGLAALEPAGGPGHGVQNVLPGSGIFDALVKGHADIAAQIGLDAHALLGSHEYLSAVDVAGKVDTLLLDLAKRRQGEDLEAAGVGEHGTVPGHEFVQTAALLHQLVTGAQMQVVGVGKLHLAADVLQVLGA